VTVHMPSVPPSARHDSGNTDVKLYWSGPAARTMWIAETSLEWLLCYITDEVTFGAVDVSGGESDSQPQHEPNCQVDGLHISWDFQQGPNGAWRAEFVTGPLKGHVSTSMVEQLDMTKWDAVAVSGSKSLAESSYDDRKTATRRYLASACDAMLQQGTSNPS
jgi:hypothetical protein